MKDNPAAILWAQLEEALFQTVCKAVKHATADNSKSESVSDDRLYTKDEICHELNISKTTLTAWMNDNKVPFLRLGRRIYFQKHLVLEAGRTHQKYQRRK